MTVSGSLLKMTSELRDNQPVLYHLPLGEERIPLNPLLGKKICLEWTGNIYDIYDGAPIKKSFGQGYSYKHFISLAQCDSCIVKPELCHYHQGTCREPQWGEKHCFIPHIIYLSITSGVKIGITRHTQTPTRWIDQGAVKALPILKVEDRKTSGEIESEISKTMADKTNWRPMLKGEYEDVDLYQRRDELFELHADLLDATGAEDLNEEVLEIQYPILEIPKKFSSLSFDKTSKVEGTLLGIKGQYLIFDHAVINMRKHQGYEVSLTHA